LGEGGVEEGEGRAVGSEGGPATVASVFFILYIGGLPRKLRRRSVPCVRGFVPLRRTASPT
jgi:hypothetical protein